MRQPVVRAAQWRAPIRRSPSPSTRARPGRQRSGPLHRPDRWPCRRGVFRQSPPAGSWERFLFRARRSDTCPPNLRCPCLRSVEFLGESDEKPFRPADVAEPIRVFIPDYFAYELRAALAEPFKRLVDVVHGEHNAEIA